jgi:hypothetical protein
MIRVIFLPGRKPPALTGPASPQFRIRNAQKRMPQPDFNKHAQHCPYEFQIE